jgi:hypothetical protein
MLVIPAASAQTTSLPPVADSSAARIMTRVGTQAEAPWLRDILRQSRRAHPKVKLDEIADSLVARATTPRGGEVRSEEYRLGVSAINALIQAGNGGPAEGQPYAGAFDRLITVHRTATSSNIRVRALVGLLSTSSHARAVAYLRSVAESSDSTAYNAIDFLITDANGGGATRTPTASERQESIATLKALASRGRVTDGRAAKLLGQWSSRNP